MIGLPLSRYNAIRSRLLVLFNILNNRLFEVWLTPQMMMSLEDMRDRPEYTQEGFANDTGYYTEYQNRHMKIPMIIDILPNMASEADIGFNNPTRVIPEIYESIQEYLQLWCELYRKAPEFPCPPMEELRKLELLAYTLFGQYKRIKPYQERREQRMAFKNSQAADKRGVLGLMALLGMKAMGHNDQDGISFISHLDEIHGNVISDDLSFNHHPVITQKAVVDSLAAPTKQADLGEWIFNPRS